MPILHSKPSTNIKWGSTGDAGFTQTKAYAVKPVESESTDGHLNLPGSKVINFTAADSHGLFPSKALNQGLLILTIIKLAYKVFCFVNTA